MSDMIPKVTPAISFASLKAFVRIQRRCQVTSLAILVTFDEENGGVAFRIDNHVRWSCSLRKHHRKARMSMAVQEDDPKLDCPICSGVSQPWEIVPGPV